MVLRFTINCTLPLFAMCFNLATGDIIYGSEDESIDLSYTIDDDGVYIFYSNDEKIIDYLSLTDDLKIGDTPIKSRVLSMSDYINERQRVKL